MKFSVCIKSGTSGHSDYDNCDLVIAVIDYCELPSVNDIIKLDTNDKYLVREIQRSYVNIESNWRSFITVYVIKV